MANYARIINNIAVDVCADPATSFHPTLAAEFVSVPNSVQRGWIKTGSTWAAPEPTVEPTPVVILPKLTPIEFKMCFTYAERLLITDRKANDRTLQLAFEILDDPRLTFVDLNLQSTKDTIDYVASLSIITPERALEIKAGVIK